MAWSYDLGDERQEYDGREKGTRKTALQNPKTWRDQCVKKKNGGQEGGELQNSKSKEVVQGAAGGGQEPLRWAP